VQNFKRSESLEENDCPLCQRTDLPELTEHHVVPKSRGGRDTISICRDCHRQIHALFDNKTLECELNSIEDLKKNPSIMKFLKWIRKKPYGSVHKARRSNNTRSRGRRG
jgi:hypothetical protein